MSETGRCRVHVPEGATPKDGPSARRRHSYRDRLRDGRHSGAPRPRHDRRNHAARPRVADRRSQGEAARGLAWGIKTVLIPEENAKDLVENRGQHQEWARDRSGVRTENSILIDHVTEPPNVSGDDRAALFLPGPARLAVCTENSDSDVVVMQTTEERMW